MHFSTNNSTSDSTEAKMDITIKKKIKIGNFGTGFSRRPIIKPRKRKENWEETN